MTKAQTKPSFVVQEPRQQASNFSGKDHRFAQAEPAYVGSCETMNEKPLPVLPEGAGGFK